MQKQTANIHLYPSKSPKNVLLMPNQLFSLITQSINVPNMQFPTVYIHLYLSKSLKNALFIPN